MYRLNELELSQCALRRSEWPHWLASQSSSDAFAFNVSAINDVIHGASNRKKLLPPFHSPHVFQRGKKGGAANFATPGGAGAGVESKGELVVTPSGVQHQQDAVNEEHDPVVNGYVDMEHLPAEFADIVAAAGDE
jgi:hypothetical protein